MTAQKMAIRVAATLPCLAFLICIFPTQAFAIERNMDIKAVATQQIKEYNDRNQALSSDAEGLKAIGVNQVAKDLLIL